MYFLHIYVMTEHNAELLCRAYEQLFIPVIERHPAIDRRIVGSNTMMLYFGTLSGNPFGARIQYIDKNRFKLNAFVADKIFETDKLWRNEGDMFRDIEDISNMINYYQKGAAKYEADKYLKSI